MKIGIGLNFYQDFSSLRRMYNSLQPYPIDLVIAVDGKYQHWPDPEASELSNVGKWLNIFHSLDNSISSRYIDASNLTQIEKRNIYFDYCNKKDIDVLIVMDSDEYIVHDKTDWSLFIKDLEQKIKTNPSERQSYGIIIKGYDVQGDSTKPASAISYPLRLFHRPGELEYYGNHYTIRNKHTKLIQVYNHNFKCENIMIANDHTLRDSERLKQQGEYAKLRPH